MRTPWLLASIVFHSAAVLVALLVGVCGPAFVRPPVARIEIRNAPPSAPARAELRATPEVAAEDEAGGGSGAASIWALSPFCFASPPACRPMAIGVC